MTHKICGHVELKIILKGIQHFEPEFSQYLKKIGERWRKRESHHSVQGK